MCPDQVVLAFHPVNNICCIENFSHKVGDLPGAGSTSAGFSFDPKSALAKQVMYLFFVSSTSIAFNTFSLLVNSNALSSHITFGYANGFFLARGSLFLWLVL